MLSIEGGSATRLPSAGCGQDGGDAEAAVVKRTTIAKRLDLSKDKRVLSGFRVGLGGEARE